MSTLAYPKGEWAYENREAMSWSTSLAVAIALAGAVLHPAVQDPPPPSLQAVLELPAPPPPPTPPVKLAETRQPPPQVPVRAPSPPAQTAPRAVAEAPAELPPMAAPVRPVEPSPSAPTQAYPHTPPNAPAATATATSPAAATPSPAAPRQGSSSSTYAATLVAYLERIKRYPTSREARLTRPQGSTQVWLEIDRQGRLLAAGIATSSGSNLLDAQALATLRSGQYPAFPDDAFPGESAHRFTATLKYSIDSN